ncbi:hypothetical protein S40288_10030 [Stachybotrys chartarum IBT 40288]|nr:hypothetical protein S40288_10030 [Stachybotrys chartarum IBT 40288]
MSDGAEDGHKQKPPPPSLNEASMSRGGVVVKRNPVAAIEKDGRLITISSPAQRLNEDTTSQSSNAMTFKEKMDRIASGSDSRLRKEYHQIRTSGNKRASGFKAGDDSVRRRPKRRRALGKAERDEPVVTVTAREGIRVADPRATTAFYEARFTKCQQEICRQVAKEWIKAIEPKKQSTHPYKKGETDASTWWPRGGHSGQDKVRHKEPDHIFKNERVNLLIHILRQAMEPYAKQDPSFKTHGINVKKLEEIALKKLSSFYEAERKHLKKRPFLAEIFKVARAEERYKNGEIDDTTEIFVNWERDRSPSLSSTVSPKTPHDQHEIQWPKPHESMAARPAHASPRSLTQPTHLANEVPLRNSQYSGPLISDPAVQQQGFSKSNGVPIQVQEQTASTSSGGITTGGVSSPHDTSRRHSLYSDYSTSTNAAVAYTQQPWQPGSASTTASPLYAFTPTHSSPSHSQPAAYVQHPVPLNSDSSYVVGSFHGSLPPVYRPNSNSLFIPAALDHTCPAGQTWYSCVPKNVEGMHALADASDLARPLESKGY